MAEAFSHQDTKAFCSRCGSRFDGDARFCQQCGTARITPLTETPKASAKANAGLRRGLMVGGLMVGLLVLCIGALMLAPDASKVEEPSFVTAEQALIAKATADMRNQMNDPASAKFKDTIGSVTGNCVVGSVLAKNAFGGYTGYHRFVWVDGAITSEESDGLIAYIDASQACVDKRSAETDARIKANS